MSMTEKEVLYTKLLKLINTIRVLSMNEIYLNKSRFIFKDDILS